MRASNVLIALALALLTGVGCAVLTGRSGSGGAAAAGSSADADKEYHRKLDLYGVGQPCPEGGAKLWGRATRDDYGIVGMVDSSTGNGQYEHTLWIGRSGEHAAALTCSGGTVVSKVLCGEMRCIPCAQTRECPAPQTCHYGRCQ